MIYARFTVALRRKLLRMRYLRLHILPKWGKRVALGIEPLEIEAWLKGLERGHNFENPTLDRLRRIMSLIYKSAQRYGLIPRGEQHNPLRFVRCKTTGGYDAIAITPAQACAIWSRLPEPQSTLVLLCAATGLRIQAREIKHQIALKPGQKETDLSGCVRRPDDTPNYAFRARAGQHILVHIEPDKQLVCGAVLVSPSGKQLGPGTSFDLLASESGTFQIRILPRERTVALSFTCPYQGNSDL